jgi:hypothetical protein
MGSDGLVSSFPIFLNLISSFFFFSTDFQKQESRERRKGLGRFKNRLQTFLKTGYLSQNNLQMFCELYSFCLNLN